MAYQLTDINRRALSDPAEFLRDSDKRYEAKLEKSAKRIKKAKNADEFLSAAAELFRSCQLRENSIGGW